MSQTRDGGNRATGKSHVIRTQNDHAQPPAGVAGATAGRPPNFLQKLFEFLSLDPHPCPDIMYWAADSKQLVVAQPDRLAKEILPRLFKHDKISSFGRQLNIYGFSRVFPGRQFKDSTGTVLDASVWAHPTLHRLSSASEVLTVKRRAAPKLFRTRRMANGQIVRTRAGPDVERKFREIKEDMAFERRMKQSGTFEALWSPEASRAPGPEAGDGSRGVLTEEMPRGHREGDSRKGSEDSRYSDLHQEGLHNGYQGPAYDKEVGHSKDSNMQSPYGRREVSVTYPGYHPTSWEGGEYSNRLPLARIDEHSTLHPTYIGSLSDHHSRMRGGPDGHSLDTLIGRSQHEAQSQGVDARLVMPASMQESRTPPSPLDMGLWMEEQYSPLGFFMGAPVPLPVKQMFGNGGRYFASCPASIHTSPVLSPRQNPMAVDDMNKDHQSYSLQSTTPKDAPPRHNQDHWPMNSPGSVMLPSMSMGPPSLPLSLDGSNYYRNGSVFESTTPIATPAANPFSAMPFGDGGSWGHIDRAAPVHTQAGGAQHDGSRPSTGLSVIISPTTTMIEQGGSGTGVNSSAYHSPITSQDMNQPRQSLGSAGNGLFGTDVPQQLPAGQNGSYNNHFGGPGAAGIDQSAGIDQNAGHSSSWKHTGAIDPRWVSPQGSSWNTPAATPRGGSPIGGVPAFFAGDNDK